MAPDVTPDSQQTTYTRTSDDHEPQAQGTGKIYVRADVPILFGVSDKDLAFLRAALGQAAQGIVKATAIADRYRSQAAGALVCTWTEDNHGGWLSSCGESWYLESGTPAGNRYRFCPGCGNVIEVKQEA